MNVRSLLAAAAAGLFVSIAAPAVRAEDAAAVRKQIEAAYARSDKAVKTRDVSHLMDDATPDMTSKTEGRVIKGTDLINVMKQQLAMFKSIDEVSSKITSFKVNGGTAVVNAESTLVGTLVGPDQKPHKLRSVSKDRDTWVKTPKGWKVKLTETLGQKNTLDGKAAPGM